jgi:SAM-dependent methyltransferase
MRLGDEVRIGAEERCSLASLGVAKERSRFPQGQIMGRGLLLSTELKESLNEVIEGDVLEVLRTLPDETPETGRREHLAVFPLELPARIIYSVLEDKPGIVIDPFCGTGTALVAAKLLEKNYVGIEIDPYYAMYARKQN